MTTSNSLKDNSPNAARLMTSLRHLDYDNITAISDLIDNAIDAEASQIWISLLSSSNGKGVDSIEILDNGSGMDMETLDEALKLGSDTEKNPEYDLGLYGMGLVTASISLGRRLDVYTQRDNKSCIWSAQDIDIIVQENRFAKWLEPVDSNSNKELSLKLATAQERFPLLEHPGRAGKPSFSGTLIKISKIDNCVWKDCDALGKRLLDSLGRTFRQFLSSGSRFIYVNGIEVKPIDPIRDFEPTILSEEEITLEEGKIRIVIAELKDYGHQLNREKGINPANQGFYILRNNREIATGETLGLFTRHNSFNLLRIELSYPATLDHILNSSFTKQRISLPQNVRDKLERACMPFIKQVSKRNRETNRKELSKEENFGDVEKYITQKAHLLKIPKMQVEERSKRKRGTGSNEPSTVVHGPRLNITKRKRVDIDSLKASFRKKELGERGPLYEADMERDTVVVYWNSQHAFYTDFIAPHSDSPDVLYPVCFLVYALASAELQSRQNSDTETILENIKWEVGSNLAVLLK